ncbi:hypothetical protein [Sporosarcina sp. HYO08]|uniref:hypothetical protein n=1 Tax=Sporosarcina sp. HYO08 TaxID=1759557 RepID=UPI0007935341|nr:hypothetical protein [Sporosarcina sp. HYO08]KXH83769.1 hypothetical protein AU377_03100 [Sporosarcina sp. HYO08]
MNEFDKKITKALHQQTDRETESMKEDIWNGLEETLFSEENHPKGAVKKMKRKNKIIPLIIIVAAALAIVFSLNTKPGLALIKGIKDMFVPEKEVIQNIEGQDETNTVNLHEGTDAEYIIYIDETRYKMTKGEDADIVTTAEPLPAEYPEVSMEIKQVPNEKPEDLVKKVEAELKKEFPELRAIEEVTEPVQGYLLHGINGGNDRLDPVVHTYVISNGKEGSFIIQERYFLEAAEGHGARFHRMLETFEIVD